MIGYKQHEEGHVGINAGCHVIHGNADAIIKLFHVINGENLDNIKKTEQKKTGYQSSQRYRNEHERDELSSSLIDHDFSGILLTEELTASGSQEKTDGNDDYTGEPVKNWLAGDLEQMRRFMQDPEEYGHCGGTHGAGGG